MYVSKLAMKIAHLRKKKEETPMDPHPSHFIEQTAILSRKRSTKKRWFSDEDIIDISYKVLIK